MRRFSEKRPSTIRLERIDDFLRGKRRYRSSSPRESAFPLTARSPGREHFSPPFHATSEDGSSDSAKSRWVNSAGTPLDFPSPSSGAAGYRVLYSSPSRS